MKNILLAIGAILVLLVGGFFAFNSYIYNEKQGDGGLVSDYKEVTFWISGEPITLIDGISKIPIAEDSASMTTTQYFGNTAMGDLEGDGDEDMVFLVTQDGGGSGTFFFLVGAIKEEGGYRGTHAVFIGDRIAPQVTEYHGFSGVPGGYIIVNYAERRSDEAMTVAPSIGKSLYLKYDPESNSFGELVQNFEGEHANTDTFVRMPVRVGEKISALGVSITVNDVVEDSRCPTDVTCVWEGTVKVRATLESGLGTADQVFELNKPITTEAEEVTLGGVAPAANSSVTLKDSDYTFYFEIRKR